MQKKNSIIRDTVFFLIYWKMYPSQAYSPAILPPKEILVEFADVPMISHKNHYGTILQENIMNSASNSLSGA